MIPSNCNLALRTLPLLFLLLSAEAPALQIIDARDGETVLAKISQKELTRIAVAHGRVRTVTGNAGEFVLEKDEEQGQVYLRPATDSAKPINVFVTSEHGTVALLLQPVDMPSDTIVIRGVINEGHAPVTGTVPAAHSASYVRGIKNLVLMMATDVLPDDMEVRELARPMALWKDVSLTLQRIYLGSEIVGEKYQLTNLSTHELRLSERDLYKAGVMAVSLESDVLHAGATTNVFIVRERRSDD